ncbi:hypothetical protein Syun_002833 [Stephania yunnanensis]|uniref:RRM domain-containing protein n=1 Tax=Stephania yunnanensis TaxID=152371 RepID=A0AAP0L059_9MAGN
MHDGEARLRWRRGNDGDDREQMTEREKESERDFAMRERGDEEKKKRERERGTLAGSLITDRREWRGRERFMADDDETTMNRNEAQQALEKQLAENPSDYDAHLNYIKLLRKRDDIDKLRQARESMAAIFPLTPSMWQEWANDEATLSTGIKDFATIEQLYERGQHDYLSVSLWCDYLNFVLKHDPSVCEFSSSGVSKMRNLFERALTAAGLHVSEGSKVWEAYIAFEETVLANVSKKNEQEPLSPPYPRDPLPLALGYNHNHLHVFATITTTTTTTTTNAVETSFATAATTPARLSLVDNDATSEIGPQLLDENVTTTSLMGTDVPCGHKRLLLAHTSRVGTDVPLEHIHPLWETEKQLQRIRSIFHRQLSVPLTDLSSVFHAYKSWELEHVNVPERSSEFEAPSHHFMVQYILFNLVYTCRPPFTNVYSRKGKGNLMLLHFIAYLHFETSSGDPARVQILYERAITEFPISSDLWLSYARYLDQTIKVPKIVVDAYSRATRNCTWVKELWVGYMLSMERACASEKELSAVFEEALQCSFSNFDEYLDLFLTRIDGLRRRISTGMSEQDGLNYAAIREIFQRATDYLSPSLMSSEGLLHLHLYWSRLELHHAKDLVAARGVWESLLKTSGTMIEVWQHYINMEIEMGHLDEARAIYRRCYSRRFAGTGSEDICHRWLRFEREYGTLDDYDRAKKKVYFLSLVAHFTIIYAIHSRNFLLPKNPFEEKELGRDNEEGESGGLIVSVPTKKKNESLDFDTKKSSWTSDFGSCSLYGSHQSLINILAVMELKILKDQRKEKLKILNEKCILYLANLMRKVGDGDLRDFFSDVGGVTGIRLLKDKFTGKSRGLAYVDFVDDKRLSAAVTKNKQILLGKKLSIARSDPNRNKKDGGFERRKHEHGPQLGQLCSMEVNVGQVLATPWTVWLEREKMGCLKTNPWIGLAFESKQSKTAFLPRTVVRNIGRSSNEQGDDTSSKSNDEFRKMLLKK